jgi:hypothetical protein
MELGMLLDVAALAAEASFAAGSKHFLTHGSNVSYTQTSNQRSTRCGTDWKDFNTVGVDLAAGLLPDTATVCSTPIGFVEGV